ncbi:D-Ala-D-Ala carboxypeptidase family metallohydrolase [Idiomarina abyssalis]|uniref:D-Ala-D-Ala carboxypeptidase family metallohydrolase n=1 Tax=Idiomarina abyssalis TaxID=86102 RepID=UPI003A8F7120
MKTRLQNSASFVPSITFDGKVYFSTSELGCRCEVCQGRGLLAPGFREKLLALRLVWNKPMAVSSCCRCNDHNREERGSPGSFHKYEVAQGACAIDFQIYDSEERANLVELALALGWRVGVANSFVHLDMSPALYPEQQKRKLFLY